MILYYIYVRGAEGDATVFRDAENSLKSERSCRRWQRLYQIWSQCRLQPTSHCHFTFLISNCIMCIIIHYYDIIYYRYENVYLLHPYMCYYTLQGFYRYIIKAFTHKWRRTSVILRCSTRNISSYCLYTLDKYIMYVFFTFDKNMFNKKRRVTHLISIFRNLIYFLFFLILVINKWDIEYKKYLKYWIFELQKTKKK